MLKARYFPRGDFLTAGQSNSSYTWQSILQGREVLEWGLIWVVGDGRIVRVWKDPLVFGAEYPCVQSERGEERRDMVVWELMANDYLGWDCS